MIALTFALSLAQFERMPSTEPAKDSFELMPPGPGEDTPHKTIVPAPASAVAPLSPVLAPRRRVPKGVQGSLIVMAAGLGMAGMSLVIGANCQFSACTAPQVLFLTAIPVAVVGAIVAIVDACLDRQ